MTKRRAFRLREIKPRDISPGDAEMLSSTVDTGVTKSKAVVLEIDLGRIKPDLNQPRRILPSDLHERLREGEITCPEAIEELLRRRGSDDVARLILEGNEDTSGLLDLAESIGELGLRQPINVYEIIDLDHPTGVSYRIGEGERRYWAHWLLVLGGREGFKRTRCVVEKSVPDDTEVRIRQLAENAVRQELPALARARGILWLRTSLAQGLGIEIASDADLDELDRAIAKVRRDGSGTRVPGEDETSLPLAASETVVIPTRHELDDMVGRTLRQFTGKSVSGRTVRNYLSLLRLPPKVRELADAAALSEFRLRPVVSLGDPSAQLNLVRRIIEEGLSGRQADVLAKEAQALHEDSGEVVGKAGLMDPTPQGLRRRIRSTVTYLEKQMEEMGGCSSFLTELGTIEQYVEAVHEMVKLRDLLTQILAEVDALE